MAAYPGFGKTAAMLALAALGGGDTLVLVPSFLVGQWAREAAAFFDHFDVLPFFSAPVGWKHDRHPGAKARPKTNGKPLLAIAPHSAIRWTPFADGTYVFRRIVVDEWHVLAAPP